MKLVLRSSLALAPVAGSRHFGQILVLALCAISLAFAQWALPKPMSLWRWFDVLAEGGVAGLLALWLWQLRASRPAGRVTTWLCLGLSGLLLGAWADWMDEFWKVPRELWALHHLEGGLQLLGLLGLSWGLQLWRQEQLALNQLRAGRERAYREHSQVDGLTQLGDGAYLLDQLRQGQAQGRSQALLMLGWADLDRLAREQGLAEAERVLLATGPLLLLGLRPGDLLCRYGKDCFVALPGTPDARLGEDLAALLQAYVHPCASGERLRLRPRLAQASLAPGADAEALLLQLLERGR